MAAKSHCGIVLSNARKRYGNSKEGKSKAMQTYQNCRKKYPTKKSKAPKRRRRRSKMFGLF
jgi:hypothetical protein